MFYAGFDAALAAQQQDHIPDVGQMVQGCKECDGQTYMHSQTGEYLGECPYCSKEQDPYAYDVPTEDGTELAYAIYYTKYNNPLPEGAIPLYASQQEPVCDITFSRFLSDVLTAAGLVSHGKQCKALGDRLGEYVMKYRTTSQAQTAELSSNPLQLPAQVHQPYYKLNELAQIIMSDCGISTTNNDHLYDRILGRLIASSELQSQAQKDDYASHDTAKHHEWLKQVEAENASKVNELVCDASQSQQPAKIVFDSESARQFLIESVLPKFSDSTFQKYVLEELAGDFAYQLAMYLQSQAQQEPADSELEAKRKYSMETGNAFIHLPQAQQTESQAITFDSLSGGAKDVLIKLRKYRALDDGDLPSKSGMNELITIGLADKDYSLPKPNVLTIKGMSFSLPPAPEGSE
nr:hypothetical protein [uncultured Undibacterium sp.]